MSTRFQPRVNINVIPQSRPTSRKKVGSGKKEQYIRRHIVPMFKSGLVQFGCAIEIRDQYKGSWERLEHRFPQFKFTYSNDYPYFINGEWVNRCSVYISAVSPLY